MLLSTPLAGPWRSPEPSGRRLTAHIQIYNADVLVLKRKPQAPKVSLVIKPRIANLYNAWHNCSYSLPQKWNLNQLVWNFGVGNVVVICCVLLLLHSCPWPRERTYISLHDKILVIHPPQKKGICPKYTLLMASLPILSSYKNLPFAQLLNIPFCLLTGTLLDSEVIEYSQWSLRIYSVEFLTACSLRFPEEDTQDLLLSQFPRSLSMTLEFRWSILWIMSALCSLATWIKMA